LALLTLHFAPSPAPLAPPGYFTSRPALKGYVRDSSSVMQASKQIQFFGAPPSDMGKGNPLYRLERALGVTQHHDSVSGTSKQHVAYDYARRLAWGREDAAAGNKLALQALTRFKGAFATCDLANATICPALETPVVGQSVLVLVWNQQAQDAPAMPVRIPAMLASGTASYSVQGPDGSDLVAQLVPASGADISLRVGYYGAVDASSIVWVCFQAPVPALGFAAFFLTAKASAAEAPRTHVSVPRKMATGAAKALRAAADETLTNGVVTLTISAATGMLSNYADSAENVSLPLAQSFFYYNSSNGMDAPNDGTSDYNQASGAYIFRTNSSTNFPVASGAATVEIVTGPVVNEARMVCADNAWITQVVRLWAGAHSADVEMTVGPVPRGPAPQGKEVVVRYSTNLVTNKSWATDSNVRDMIPRVRDYRATWPYQVYEPVAGNYVPVNSRIITSDVSSGVTLSVTTDRTQGGSSMVDGSLELMVHRRLQQDDRRGVGEPINEPGLDASGSGLVIRALHRISVLPAASAAARGKQDVQDLMFRPLVTFSPLGAGATPAAWLAANTGNWSGAGASRLPPSVHLVTTHAWGPHEVLVRLAHLFETGEDAALSAPVTLDLTTLYAGAPLSACVEMTVPASQPLSNVPVRTVSTTEGPSTYPTIPAAPSGSGQTITIAPMEVRTFKCAY
jgi:lysosomal alpha-mannosidase